MVQVVKGIASHFWQCNNPQLFVDMQYKSDVALIFENDFKRENSCL